MPEITFTNLSALPAEITAGDENLHLFPGESRQVFFKEESFLLEAAEKKSSEIKCGRLFKSLILSCCFPVRSRYRVTVNSEKAEIEFDAETSRGYICGDRYERLVPLSPHCSFEKSGFSVADEGEIRESLLKKGRRLAFLNAASAVAWFCEYYLPIPAFFALIFALAYWQTDFKSALISTGIVAAIAAAAAAVVCIPLLLLSKKLTKKLEGKREKRRKKARSRFHSYRHLLDESYIEAVIAEGG